MAAERLAQISAFLHSDPRLSNEGADMIDGLIKSTYERIASAPSASRVAFLQDVIHRKSEYRAVSQIV